MCTIEIQKGLSAPFPSTDIEFRVCRVSQRTKKANVLAYITARGIMRRLDEVFGIDGWRDEYEVLDSGVKCRLTVRLEDAWITKEDVAQFTQIEALKGAFSDSLKRAGVKFGIGRYLYDLPDYWVEVLPERPPKSDRKAHYHNSDNVTGWWLEPVLPDWALPEKDHGQTGVDKALKAKLDDILDRQLLTESKHGQFVSILSSPHTSDARKKLIRAQLELIELWETNVLNHPTMPQAQKRELYLAALSATSKNASSVRRLLHESGAEEAA